MNIVAEFVKMLDKSEYTVFFGGAGVSTESGLPDFRSQSGIYKNVLNAEMLLTPQYLTRKPEEFYKFYREYFMVKGIRPNNCHIALSELEKRSTIKAVITQNVDGLHQSAGSKNVIELHGTGNSFYCINCGKKYSFEAVDEMDLVPKCSCGGMIRPDVVLFTEGLDSIAIDKAASEIAKSDLLVVGGTSLTVYPAAGFIDCRNESSKLVVINKSETPSDYMADLLIREPIAQFFSEVLDYIENKDNSE